MFIFSFCATKKGGALLMFLGFKITVSTGWWFQTYFIFSYIGSSQLINSYSSEGLAQPPVSDYPRFQISFG
jgi:hypothetical protein